MLVGQHSAEGKNITRGGRESVGYYLRPDYALGGPQKSDGGARAVEKILGVGRHGFQGLAVHRDG